MNAAGVTELDVLRDVQEWFKDPDHYTSEHYHVDSDDGDGDSTTSAQTCAVGGVEHSIWKLTRVAPDEYREDLSYVVEGENTVEVVVDLEPDETTRDSLILYASVMQKLNWKAHQMFGVRSIEQVTVKHIGGVDDNFQAMREVIDAVIEDLS